MKNLMMTMYQVVNNAHEYKTYSGRAIQEATYPYVVYKLLPISPTVENRDDYTLEISCWDKSESTSHTTVVDIAEKIRNALLEYRELHNDHLIMVSRPSVGYIPDPDTQIKRYDVTSTLMTYRRV